MKRFHVNVSVQDIAEGIRFYSALFAVEPTVQKDDYAKWMLDDPRMNFAITQRGYPIGVNHLGFQVDSAGELTAMRAQLARADRALIEQADAACCYAKSDKVWITDPAGVAWETFHTQGVIPIYGADSEIAPKTGGCCVPPKATDEACCEPAVAATSGTCCAT
ncbi:MAG TPA: ArsI/CadI family heavy metal resistance metalloenzyme [Steroidobacteraceae bacterium]|nr:ArsI/CadI family heavy metal resistance metalloenzyme [Steroidobacteraceae bacterium]